jgi:hypothetical protein
MEIFKFIVLTGLHVIIHSLEREKAEISPLGL